MKYNKRMFRAQPIRLLSDFELDCVIKYEDKFVYGNLIYDDYMDCSLIVGDALEANEEYISIERWTPVDNRTIGMSTGVRDKKGKMIYEGDIVQSHVTDVGGYTNWKELPCLCIVYYEKGHFKLSFLGVFQAYDKRYKNGEYAINPCDEGLDGELLEVVDNIHGIGMGGV